MAEHDMLIERPIANIIAKQASDFVAKKLRSLCGVEEEVSSLKSKLSAIQATLRDAEGSFSRANSEQRKNWLMKLKDAALDAGDVLDTYETDASLRKILNKHNPISSAVEIYETSESIKKIMKRIDDICQEGIDFYFSVRPERAREEANQRNIVAGPVVDTTGIYGRKVEKGEIIAWLMSEEPNAEDDVPALPIIGMAGLGKTCLAQLVYHDEAVKGHFTNLIWVDVRRKFELERFGKELMESITEMEMNLNSWEALVRRIVEVLRGKRFLLVLDDLWEATPTDWEKLQEILKKGLKGSRILVTSRIQEIARTIRAPNPLLLGLLPEEECCLLFAKKAFIGGQPPSTEIEELSKKIVQKCNGLPLAVAAMGSTLYSCTEIHTWRSIERDGIWEKERQNDLNGRPTILPALRLSYDHLPPHLKQCFAYCSLFPQGYMYDKNDLVKLWMAEGYVESREEATLGEFGGEYFDILVSRSFFQPINIDNKDGHRIHDLFHDLAKSVSGHSCIQVEDNKPWSAHGDSRHVSFLSKDVHQPASQILLKTTKLRTVLLPLDHSRNFNQALEKILCTQKYLRVLDLSSTKMTEVPNSIGKLKLLRYLDLSDTDIRRLPDSICKLINLQTLKLLRCVWLSELPNEFSRLLNLWHLELDEMFWNKNPSLPPRMGTLTNLQNLHFFCVGQDSTQGVDQLQGLKSLKGKLHISHLERTDTASSACLKQKEDLEELVFQWSDGSINLQDPGIQETVLEELEPHSNIKVLQIHGYKGRTSPVWLSNTSFQTLTEVRLSNCVDVKILNLGPLPHLQKVHLKSMQSLEEWPEMFYPSLDWLQISKCPKLKKLPSFFPNLRVMKIKKCQVLKDLPVSSCLMFLVLIDNIMLENWNEESLQEREMNGEEIVSVSIFPCYIPLLELQIKNCQSLRGLPNIFAPQKLEISNCPLILALPPPDYSGRLQHLALDWCTDSTLVEAIPSSSSAYSLVISNIARLISLPLSISLSGLKALHISDCGDLESLSNNEGGTPLSSFTALTLLSISGCPKLTVITSGSLPLSLEYLIIKNCLILESFGPQNFLVELNALRDLHLEGCPKIRSLPDGGLPACLKHLYIQRCPLLSQRFSNGAQYDQLLASIADVDVNFI